MRGTDGYGRRWAGYSKVDVLRQITRVPMWAYKSRLVVYNVTMGIQNNVRNLNGITWFSESTTDYVSSSTAYEGADHTAAILLVGILRKLVPRQYNASTTLVLFS